MKIKRQLVRKFPARPEYSLFRKRKSLFCFGRELPINRRTCAQIDVCPDEIGTKSREFAVLFPVRREFTPPAPLHRQHDDALRRRALSRRKTAIQAFDAALAASRPARGKRALRPVRAPAAVSEPVTAREADRPAASCQNKATAAPRQCTPTLRSDKTKPPRPGPLRLKARPRSRDRPANRPHHRRHGQIRAGPATTGAVFNPPRLSAVMSAAMGAIAR